MSPATEPSPLLQGVKTSDYNISHIDDEIRVDQLCVNLIRHMFQTLTREDETPLDLAGELCHGADYFLREFIIGDRHENLFGINPQRVRQFAGHWYIVRTMEPNLVELRTILTGTNAFYSFLASKGLIKEEVAIEIGSNCSDHEYYQQRIEDFWAIDANGYDSWRQACPLEPTAERP